MDSDFQEDLKKRISAIKIVLSREFKFLSPLFLSFNFEISDRYKLPNGEEIMVPTAATDGFSTIIINPDFIQENNFNDNTLMGIVMHEFLHILFNHTNRIRERQPFLWNVATDAAINYVITKIFKMSLPEGSVEGIDNSAEKIYDELMKDYQPILDKLRSMSVSLQDSQGSQDTQDIQSQSEFSSSFGNQKQSQSKSSLSGNQKQSQSKSSSSGNQKQSQSGSSSLDGSQKQDQGGSSSVGGSQKQGQNKNKDSSLDESQEKSQTGSSSGGKQQQSQSQKQNQSGSSSAETNQQQIQGQKQNQSGSSLADEKQKQSQIESSSLDENQKQNQSGSASGKNQQQGEEQEQSSSANSQESGTDTNKQGTDTNKQGNIQSGQQDKTTNKTSSAKSNKSKQSIEEQAAKKTIEKAGIKGNNFDKHDLWKTVEQIAANDPKMQEQIRQYREAIEEVIKSALFGDIPEGWKILLDKQIVQEPSFGWLEKFKSSLKTVSAPGNNPFSNRVKRSSADPRILQRIRSMQVMSNPVVIALDTSGSITKEEIGTFVGYFLNAIRDNGPRRNNYIFITCDADIHSVISIGNTPRKNYMITFHNGEEKKKYLSLNDIKFDNLMKLILEEGLQGGGGTSFVPVFEYLKKESIKPAFLFYFTDCDGEYPEQPPKYKDNVYWMFYQETKDATPYTRPPFGNLVYVSKDILRVASKKENYENEL